MHFQNSNKRTWITFKLCTYLPSTYKLFSHTGMNWDSNSAQENSIQVFHILYIYIFIQVPIHIIHIYNIILQRLTGKSHGGPPTQSLPVPIYYIKVYTFINRYSSSVVNASVTESQVGRFEPQVRKINLLQNLQRVTSAEDGPTNKNMKIMINCTVFFVFF